MAKERDEVINCKTCNDTKEVAKPEYDHNARRYIKGEACACPVCSGNAGAPVNAGAPAQIVRD